MTALARTDANQADIVKALRDAGCTVTSLHAVGQGVPDLLVGVRGQNLLLECKVLVGKRKPRAVLTEAQEIWWNAWRGQAAIVTCPEDALRAVGLLP